jgi:hypothetical protein
MDEEESGRRRSKVAPGNSSGSCEEAHKNIQSVSPISSPDMDFVFPERSSQGYNYADLLRNTSLNLPSQTEAPVTLMVLTSDYVWLQSNGPFIVSHCRLTTPEEQDPVMWSEPHGKPQRTTADPVSRVFVQNYSYRLLYGTRGCWIDNSNQDISSFK